ncbi:ABC transporter permease [Halovulum sp. GXIMD14793]
MRHSFWPVATVIGAILLLWYSFAVILNAPWAQDQAQRQDLVLSTSDLVAATWSQDKPRLPAPHQVVVELYETTFEQKVSSPRSLVFHAKRTLAATGLGFLLGTALGILLAVGIVHSRAMNASVMPWMIASQTIPILAIAPMIVVVLNSIGISGLIPKAIISTYLCFFPVAVGMVKGLRAPSAIQLDQMRTWNASAMQTFWKLRWPSSMPYLFASLKVGIAASLVGAIVAELPINQDGGLGARLLTGSYHGQTIQIWSALFMAAILAAILVGLVGLIQRWTLNRMGLQA